MIRWLLAAAIVASLSAPVFAAPLEASLRPKARTAAFKPAARTSQRPKELALVQGSKENLGFQNWIARFRGRARSAGIRATTLDRAFRGVRYNAEVIQKDRNQSEFTKQIWDYLDSAASDTRVKNGKRALRENRRVLERIEENFGVDREIVTAIWGLESAYGAFRGDFPLIEAVATLAYDGRRGRFFEAQLIAALKIIQAGDVAPKNMTGSWAGAMGHTQFIPTSYLAYAVDFTGDGRRDIWADDPTDALASTAAYLKRFGWVKGQPWGVEVALPRGFNYASANRRNVKMPSEWARLGVRDIDGRKVPNYGAASILLPAGAQGAAFMIFKNFAVIERYNAADAYVIGVGHLADRITGGDAIRAQWPRGDRPLRFSEKQEMQRLLTNAGFNTEGIDGIIGPRTISAVREFQRSIGMAPDGYASLEILKRLR